MGYTKPETAKKIHARHRARKSETGKRIGVWLEYEIIEELEELAKQKGWLNESGSKAGQPAMQQTLEAVILAGLEGMKAEN